MRGVFIAILAVGDGPPDPRAAPVDPREISRYLNERAVWDGVEPLLLSVACFLLGVGVLYALWLYRHRDRHPLPHATFHRLGREMGLSLGQRVWLWRVARRRGLPTPITLMLCPATYDCHVAAYLGGKPADQPMRDARAQRVRRRLYGEDGAIP